ncbi:MAG: gluconate dehydrogenase [Candidatus Binatia bacterium]|nr:MAG: gluconate dehydrogenase [Candidatus Binatia bacterium]
MTNSVRSAAHLQAQLPSRVEGVLGNTSLDRFDAIVIGAGAGGSAAARVLAVVGGWRVLVLEHGPNYFLGLDDPAADRPRPLFSNDELKLAIRGFVGQDPLLEPRTFRASENDSATFHPDVNTLPKTVGGAAIHADMKYPRFNRVDFRLASELEAKGVRYEAAAFADWPVSYDELEPYYAEAERLSGVQGAAGSDPFASPRTSDYPMPPGLPMYVAEVLSQGARTLGYHPFPYPGAQNSRFYRGRPPCNDCGFCSGYGCPNNSKGSPAVTTLREALLTGRCQLRYNAHVTRLVHDGRGRVTAVEYVDNHGELQRAGADVVLLGASAIESARLCLLSNLGNESGLVGRFLMFHTQNVSVGLYRQRFHGERGRSVTQGISDLRGVRPGGDEIDPDMPLGGIVEFGTNSGAIAGAQAALQAYALARLQNIPGLTLWKLLRANVFQAHIAVALQQAEDAPYFHNYVDLDPQLKDVFGQPVPRITYRIGALERAARQFYGPRLVELHRASGADYGFLAPLDEPPQSRHVLGTLRMGQDPQSSVCDPWQKFHTVDNLFAVDGSVFVTSSGYNPTLTIIALALRAAARLVSPAAPERVLGRDTTL